MLDRIFAYALSLLIALAPSLADASQNALSSPATGTVSGLQLTNNYNNAIDSLNTCNSGASAPTNQLSGVPSLANCWLNTTSNPYPWQVYDGTNWLSPFWIDATNHYADVKIGGGVASVASASTVDLCGSGIGLVADITITGTTTITSFGSTCKAGHIKVVTFAGALTLTYNATSLIIPGAANVITAAGDQAILESLGSGNWKTLAYTPASGQALLNPAVDVGDVAWTFLQSPPSAKYLFAYGQAISRATYSSLSSSINPTISGITATNGSPTLTGFSDTTQIGAGTVIEASFLSAPSTISSCTSSTCTMAANASASTTASIQLFPYGDGCGIATACGSVGSSFNLPDCRDVAMVGRGNMGGSARTDSFALTSTYFGTSPNAIGAFGGAQSKALSQANLPIVNFPVSGTGSIGNLTLCSASGCYPNSSAAGNVAFVGSNSGNITGWFSSTPTIFMGGTAASGGSDTAFATVQPTITANCMIRVLAKLELMPLPSFAANDNDLAIEPRRAA